MPVTQQLCKISEYDFKECFSSSRSLSELVDLSLLQRKDYLDIEWNGSFFCKVIEVYENASAIDYHNLIHGIHGFEFDVDVIEQPKYLKPAEVKRLIDKLEDLNIEEVLARMPNDLDKINYLLGSDFDEDPIELLLSSWKELRKFYEDALSENYYIIFWWD